MPSLQGQDGIQMSQTELLETWEDGGGGGGVLGPERIQAYYLKYLRKAIKLL